MDIATRALLVIALLTGCAGRAADGEPGQPTGQAGVTSATDGSTAASVGGAASAGDGSTAGGAASAADGSTATSVGGAASAGDAQTGAEPPPGSERHGVFADLPPTAVGLPQDFVAPPWPDDAPALHKGMLVGSWAPNGDEGFEQAWIDEPLLVQAFTKWRAGRRSWLGITTNGPRMGVDVLIRDRTGPAVAYLMSLVQRRPEDPASLERLPDVQAVLHVRHRGRLAAWFDGRKIIDAPAPPPGEVGLVQVPVVLSNGYDVLLLKLGRGSPELGDSMDVEVRVSDLDGRPIPQQDWNTMRNSEQPSDLDELGLVQGER